MVCISGVLPAIPQVWILFLFFVYLFVCFKSVNDVQWRTFEEIQSVKTTTVITDSWQPCWLKGMCSDLTPAVWPTFIFNLLNLPAGVLPVTRVTVRVFTSGWNKTVLLNYWLYRSAFSFFTFLNRVWRNHKNFDFGFFCFLCHFGLLFFLFFFFFSWQWITTPAPYSSCFRWRFSLVSHVFTDVTL